MGQAKQRGNHTERAAQALARRAPPRPGLYVSTRHTLGIRVVVTEVFGLQDSEPPGHFLVMTIDEAYANDMSAMGDELDQDQWFAAVDQLGLVPAER